MGPSWFTQSTAHALHIQRPMGQLVCYESNKDHVEEEGAKRPPTTKLTHKLAAVDGLCPDPLPTDPAATQASSEEPSSPGSPSFGDLSSRTKVAACAVPRLVDAARCGWHMCCKDCNSLTVTV